MKKLLPLVSLLFSVFSYGQTISIYNTSILKFYPVEGVASASQSYLLSGNNLNPAAGSITVTAPQYFELSTDNINFSSSPIVVSYTGGHFSLITIYVRTSSSATSPGTVLNGNIIHSGGSAPDKLLPVVAYFSKSYYNTKANLGLQNLATWSRTTDGTGASPVSFTDPYASFIIIDQTNANFTGVWDVPDFYSKVVIGDGTTPINFTILPGADYIGDNTRITVNGGSALILKNNFVPKYISSSYNSTVDYAQEGTGPSDSIQINNVSYYTLKLTGGLKYFKPGTTTIYNLIADGVVNIGAMGTSSSTVVVLSQGNMTFLNGTHFDSSAAGDSHRIGLLKFSSINGQPQQITTNGTDLVLQQIRIEGTGPVIFSPNTNLLLKSIYPTGIVFTQAESSLVTDGGLITFTGNANFFNIDFLGNHKGIINSNGTSFKFICTFLPSQYTPPSCFGRLIFTPNSTIGDLTMNTSNATDSLQIASYVKIMGAVNMIKGRITLPDSVKLELGETATTPQSGNINSYIHGEIISTGTNTRTIPIGNYKLNRFGPVDFTNHTPGNSYSFKFFPYTVYPDYTIAPSTLAIFPQYNVGRQEYWDITTTNPGSADIGLHYNDPASGVLDPAALRVAVYTNGSGWADVGGTCDPGNTLASGSVLATNVSAFGPFTFAGILPGIIPVKLISFSARKQNNAVQLLWSTAQEINSKSFIIQRSGDGILWNDIINIPAAGNSAVRKDYAANDYTPFSGFNYYRLKTVDLDNRSDLSAIKAVNFTNNSVIVMKQDLPGTPVSIYIPQENLPAAISIYDTGGKLVGRSSVTETLSRVDVSSYPKGIYVLKINGQYLQESKKIVID